MSDIRIKMAKDLRDMSDMVGDLHWMAAKAVEDLTKKDGEIAKRDEELAACRIAVENCEVFRARVVELESDRDSHQRYVMLTNLLARIHRDGGQYVKQHGMDKAFADADAIVAELYAAPSPAGVDGLEVVAWLCEWMGDKCGGVYSGLSKTSLEGLRRSQGEDVLIVSDEPLCRLSDAQAIIDGLRGENERIRLNIAEYNEAISCYQSERDQQAQRILSLPPLR